jgi:hypothetical protein
LPLPTPGYEAYLVGELHGLEENEEFELQYLRLLHNASGLRDVAIEEKAVYENDAQAFVDGRLEQLPPELCHRAGILAGIRRFNTELNKDARIRIHLTDIDSPTVAIRQHLAAIQQRLKANNVSIPDETAIRTRGLETVAQLKLLTTDTALRSELRTIEFSVAAFEQGVEVGIGPSREARTSIAASRRSQVASWTCSASVGRLRCWSRTVPITCRELPETTVAQQETNRSRPWRFGCCNPASKLFPWLHFFWQAIPSGAVNRANSRGAQSTDTWLPAKHSISCYRPSQARASSTSIRNANAPASPPTTPRTGKSTPSSCIALARPCGDHCGPH